MKAQLAVTESHLEDWVSDVKEWAEATTNTSTNDVDALASRIEVLVTSIKRRSQRLYKDTDGNKGRARIRRKIREEKGILTSVVEKYNKIVPSTESLCMETIVSGETAWPWQLPHSVRRLEEKKNILVLEMDHHWKWLSTRAKTSQELSSLLSNWPCGFSEEGLKGLQSIILRKQQNIREKKMQARDCYLRLLSDNHPASCTSRMIVTVTRTVLMMHCNCTRYRCSTFLCQWNYKCYCRLVT
ncbi:hypothetical protein JOB18_040301 [Solea senegalensis]|nr:hypothetical protein JOB18_040301 [Solea senegalensis]